MKKKKLWIAILVAFVVLVSSVVYLNRAVIFQRGNPIPYLTAAARISEKNPYVAVDEAKGIYISKRGECPELLEYYQEKTGMEFVEQAGNSYLFTDGSRNEVASSEVYWGRYTVWVLPTMEAAENFDAEQYDAKPVIYLYPEKETEVTVKLNYAGELTCTYPAYNDGWKVSASPDGTLTDADGQLCRILLSFERLLKCLQTDVLTAKHVRSQVTDHKASRLGLTRISIPQHSSFKQSRV